jgi:hypothetical protein
MNREEEARKNAMHSIIAGLNCYVDIGGWARLTCEQTHRAYRDTLTELQATKDIADSRLDEIGILIKDYNDVRDNLKGNWVSQTAHDTVKLDNMKLKAELSKFTGPGFVPKSVYDNSWAPLNPVIYEKDSRIKELEDALLGSRHSFQDLHTKLISSDRALAALKSQNFAAICGNDESRLTDEKEAHIRTTKVYAFAAKELTETRKELAAAKNKEDRLVAAVNELNVGMKRKGNKIVDLENMTAALSRQNKEYDRSQTRLIMSEGKLIKEVEKLKAEVEEQLDHHRLYYKLNIKLNNESAVLRQQVKDLKIIDDHYDVKIKELKSEISELDERVQEHKDELKAWQNERCYIAYFDTALLLSGSERITIDGEEVTAKGNCFYNSHDVKVGSYFNFGDRYLVFCDGTLSCPVSSSIR